MRLTVLIPILLFPLLLANSPPTALLERVEDAPHWVIGPLIVLATLSCEDLACVSAGLLASSGLIPFWYACTWCWIGIFAGDIGLYLIGRITGDRAAHTRLLRRFLTPKRLQKGRHMFEEHGAWVLFSARFLPGSRLPAFIGAGILKFPVPKFAMFLAFAGLIWTPAIVGMAHWWGNKVLEWHELYQKYVWLAAILAAGLTWITIRLLMPFFSERGRYLLLSSAYRTLVWQFWPPPILYLSLLPYALWLMIRSRHPLVFTAANPALPHGGLALESKNEILEKLGRSAENRDFVARWQLIPPGKHLGRLQTLQGFQTALGKSYPIVLKPDVGERGQGVLVVHSEAQAALYLRECREAVIAQEYVSGFEFSVFYYRLPSSDRGNLLSITRKRLPSVTGNGHSTVEELILHHPRALRMARVFLSQHREQADCVPAVGEVVLLSEIANHSRGALIANARDLQTKALRQTIDEISKRFEGFYIGCYDFKVPSIEALQRGSNLKILEVNGVSAEVPHIYEPGYSLFRAHRDLAHQWRIAYRIGGKNWASGSPVTSVRTLLSLVWRYWRRRPYDVNTSAQRMASISPASSSSDPDSNPNRFTGSTSC